MAPQSSNTKRNVKKKFQVASGYAALGEYAEFDFNNMIAKGFNTSKLYLSQMFINNGVPRHWRFKFDSRSIDIDAVAYMMADTRIHELTIKMLQCNDFPHKFFESITGSKNGTMYANTSMLDFDLMVQRTSEALLDTIKCDNRSVALIGSALLTEICQQLNLVAYDGGAYAITTKTRLFSTHEDLVFELRRERIAHALAKVDYQKLKTTNRMGISVVAQAVANTFNNLAIVLQRMDAVEEDLECLYSLVRAFHTKDYSSYRDEDMGIFEDPQFLAFASNVNIVVAAFQAKSQKLRPIQGAYAWQAIISRIGLALGGSTLIDAVEVSSVKELFSLSHISDSVGFKRGFILTKNMKDETPFEPFYMTSPRPGYTRVDKDKVAEQILSSLAQQFKAINSDALHDYFHKVFGLMVQKSTPMFSYTSFISEDDLVFLGVAYANYMEIGIAEESEFITTRSLIYVVNTEDSKVSEDVSRLGLIKFTDPCGVFLFAQDPIVGKKYLSYNQPVIDGTNERISYMGIDDISTDRMSKPTEVSINVGSVELKEKWALVDLLGKPTLKRTQIIIPVIGRSIMTRLIEGYLHVSAMSQNQTYGMDKNFQLAITIMLSKVLEPMIKSTNVKEITSSMVSAIWNQESGKAHPGVVSADVLRAQFYNHRFMSQLDFVAALFVAFSLNFIEDGSEIKKLVAAVDAVGGFNHL